MIFGTFVAVVGILLSSFALSDEEQMANAARLFDERAASFQEIADLVAAHDEFQHVARAFKIEREALISKNRPFDNESRTA